MISHAETLQPYLEIKCSVSENSNSIMQATWQHIGRYLDPAYIQSLVSEIAQYSFDMKIEMYIAKL